MTEQNTVGVDDFFDNIGGAGAPTAKLSDINDGVIGVIESQRVVDYIPFGKDKPEVLDDGKVRKQLVVILKTDLRNWQGVKEAPLVDREDPSKGRKPGDQDDGRRAVYIPQFKNIHYAVKDAVVASGAYDGKNGPLKDGARFGVKVVDLEDTNQGNPKKVHKALYEPPSASTEFFTESTTGSNDVTPSQAQQPAQQAQQPAAQSTPQTDPWASATDSSSQQQQTSKPPF